MAKKGSRAVTAVIESLRIRQWTKNLLVFAGLIFADKFADVEAIRVVLLTFAAFCLVSSSGYLLNDILDIESDRVHPEKRLRPIASGRLGKSAATAISVLLLLGGFGLAFLAHPNAVIALAAYVVNQGFYSLVARRVALLDVFILAAGFVIRAIAGAAAIEVEISSWLLLCTFLLALFLALAKRRHELELGVESRTSLTGYSRQLLDQNINISAASSVLAYCIYAIQSETAQAHPLLAITIPFPIFGVFRYLQIVYNESGGGSPDRALLRDPWLAGTVLAWIGISVYAMTRT